jgi:5'-nucleotidase / UDP-sugar diphosphatase
MKHFILIGFLLWVCFQTTRATEIQILHTNDIHSHLDHSIHRPELGGHGRLKSMLTRLRKQAQDEGVETIAMDAGDFSEGHIYYLADRGRTTFQIHGSVGFDVSVIGNHDYLMGAKDLDVILRDVDMSFELLGANFHTSPKYVNIKEKMKPYWETEVDGVKIGVLGLTTDDLLYEWRIGDGHISNEYKAAKKYAKELRERGNDIIIALTHIGLKKDKKLAKKVPEIDLIVGGHSHDALHSVVWQKSKKGKLIPIVQAGKHAQWLGRLRLDYRKEQKRLFIKDYELIPVNQDQKDPEVENLIASANDQLNYHFGQDWLEEPLGESRITPIHRGGKSEVWYHFITDAMVEAIGADIGMHVSALSGDNYPVGLINRRAIYNSNPRTFEFDRHMGYNVFSTRVKGVWISILTRVALRFGLPMYFSGLTFDYKKVKGSRYDHKYKIKNLRHNGRRINPFKYYKIALSEAIVRGGEAITPFVKLLMRFSDDYKYPMWLAIEERVRQFVIVDDDYLSNRPPYDKKASYVKKTLRYQSMPAVKR